MGGINLLRSPPLSSRPLMGFGGTWRSGTGVAWDPDLPTPLPPVKLVTRMDAGQFPIPWPQVRTDDQLDSGGIFGGKYDNHKEAKSGPEEQEQEAFLRSGKGPGS